VVILLRVLVLHRAVEWYQFLWSILLGRFLARTNAGERNVGFQSWFDLKWQWAVGSASVPSDRMEGRRRQDFPTQGMEKELLKSITEEELCTIQKVAKRSKVSMT
jgi:hypothetical protein